jgi:hypothetical protein
VLQLRGEIDQDDGLMSNGLYVYLGIELFVCLLHCPPGVDAEFTTWMLGFKIDYSVCDLLAALSLLKLYTVFRVL